MEINSVSDINECYTQNKSDIYQYAGNWQRIGVQCNDWSTIDLVVLVKEW